MATLSINGGTFNFSNGKNHLKVQAITMKHFPNALKKDL